MQGQKLFVGSLPYSTVEETLKEMFEQFGAVSSVKIIRDRFSGDSKGFGFVEMESADSAEAAMKELDGSSLEGRNIVVKEARERDENSRQGGGGGGGGGRRFAPQGGGNGGGGGGRFGNNEGRRRF
jgi:cold-inducible RNA-binding protein